MNKLGGRSTGVPTMKDVAALANVSVNTVSLVLRQPERVAPATRERVKAAIERLDYTPNRIAGALVTKRTKIIGVVIPTITYTSLWDIVSALTDVFDENGYQILIGMTNYSLEREARAVETFLAYRPSGMVLTGLAHSEEVHERLGRVDIPIAEVLRVGTDPIDFCVGFNHDEAIRVLVNLLWNAGHRNIAYVRTPQFETSDREAERMTGFTSELAKLGGPVDLFFTTPSTLAGGAGIVPQLLEHERGITAAIFSSYMPGLGALVHCGQSGIDIPGRIALTAFGSPTDGAATIEPGLTTIEIDHTAIGRLAAQTMIRRIAGQTLDSPTIETPYKLMRRGSA